MLTQPHQQLLPNVLYSSRRRTRRRAGPAPGQTRIPDWVWGAGLGLIVILAVGGYFLLSTGGSSGSTCDRALPPLGGPAINQQSFANADASMAQLISLLERGDLAVAETMFYGDTHNFMHTVDPALREEDEAAAKALCREVLNYEDLTTQGGSVNQILGSLTLIRGYMQDAAVTLGYDRPGEVMNIEETDEQGVPHGRTT